MLQLYEFVAEFVCFRDRLLVETSGYELFLESVAR